MPTPVLLLVRRERMDVNHNFTDTERADAREFINLHRGQMSTFTEQYMLDPEFDAHDIEE